MDRQTDNGRRLVPRLRIASRGKNYTTGASSSELPVWVGGAFRIQPGVWTTIHRGTMASPGLFYLFVSLRTQTNAAIQCLTRPMYCSTIDASTRAGGLDAVRIASAGRFSSRYGRLPLRRAAA